MTNTFLLSFLSLLLFTANPVKVNTPIAPDELICGKWQSADKKLIVLVYKVSKEFRGKMVWFKDDEDNSKMATWTDKHNPDPALRSRKLLGMDILEKLVYNAKSNTWENGVIYDAKTGRKWNSSASLDKDGTLKVKGYWHLKFIGRTLVFKRVL